MSRPSVLVSGLALALLAASCSSEPANGVEVYEADFMDVSAPWTELAKIPQEEPDVAERGRETEPARAIPRMRSTARSRAVHDPVVQSIVGEALIPSPAANFEGQGSGLPGFQVNVAPPDTIGDVGPNHFVQTVNLRMTVFSKTGAVLFGPVNTNTLWQGFAGACATTNDGDPTVRYDRTADRWVISQFSVNGGNGPFFQCIAVSTSPDPAGSYNRYQFSMPAFNDYPKMGRWPDGYYFTFNMFGAAPSFPFLGGKSCAADRTRMLAGQTATIQCFDAGVNFGGLLAADLDGTTQPPAGAPNLHVALDTNSTLATWKFHVDFATPASSTFVGPTIVNVAAFTPLCNGGTCVSQAGTTQKLDSLADRLMNRLAYRNFGTHESLVVSHSVAAGAGGGVRFYEIRTPNTPTIFQQGTYAPDANFRWMSSIAQDRDGNMGLGFSLAGTTLNPSVHYTGRLATDPAGTMGQGEGTLVNGTGSQNGGLSRWGDYSSMTVDPTDDCTFWYTQEYMGASGSFNWRTRVGSFKFASCGGAVTNDFSITPNPTSVTIAAGTSGTIQVQTAVLSGSPETIALTVSGLPTGVTGTLNPTSVTTGGSSTLTLTAAANATAGTTSFQIAGTAPSASHNANASVTVTVNNNPPTVQITSPTTGSTVSGNVNVTATAADSDGTVASVKFDLPDGTSVTDVTAPFATTWNSATVVDGPGYVIRATATDNQGATAQSSVTVTVANGGGQCINGTFNSTDVPKNIPDNNAAGITSNNVVVGNGTVASLKLSLNITHTFRGDLKVTLISPGGVQFVVHNRAGGSADNLVITNRDLTAFNGQVAAGTWKLFVQDLAAVDIGRVNSWSLTIVGNCGAQQHWSGSATPNLPTIDNGTACTSLNVTDAGDASLVKLDLAGNHAFRSILRGTLAHNGVTVAAFPTGTFPSGAGTFSFTNRTIAGMSGSATGQWTLCIVDTDAFGDTGVLNTWAVHD
jgi:subtilisin-like proprotein convertase family protein